MPTRPLKNDLALLLVGVVPFFILGFANGWYGPALLRMGQAWFWLADVTQYVVLPAAAFLWLWRYQGLQLSDLGFRGPTRRHSLGELIWFTAIAALLYFLAFDVLGRIFSWVAPTTNGNVLFAPAVPKDQPLKFLLVLYSTATAALVEEAIYRGIPWLYCKAKFDAPVLPYVLFSSIAFGIVHWEQGFGHTVGACLLGMAAAVIYVEVKNIWPLVCAHFLTGCWHYQWF